MRSLGTRRVELNPIHMNPTLNISDSPSSSAEGKDDKYDGDTLPCENTGGNDVFVETQVVDFDDETQPVDFFEETQIMDLAGETQVMDDYDDSIEHIDTQVLELSDSETDGEDSRRTQCLDDTVGLNDIQVAQRSDRQPFREDDGEDKQESLASDDLRQSSGSLRRGSTFDSTASIRVVGRGACKMAAESGKIGPCFGVTDKGSSELHLNSEDETGLGLQEKCEVSKPLARQLFVEEEVGEEGCDNSLGQKADFSSLPACDDQLAGLSYIDSQEPGELSQANALNFVDKFLKVNLLESDEDILHKNVVRETVTPGAVVLGTKCIAQEASRRNSLVGTSIYEWDDKLEDEGGGEFFSKKKEAFFGTQRGARKSHSKPQSSRCRQPKRNLSLGRSTWKERKNVHDTVMGLLHSDSKLPKDRKLHQIEETHIHNRIENHTDEQVGLVLGAEVAVGAPTIESVDLLNVGIDTQMAAEAMEALATGTALLAKAGGVNDHCLENVGGRKNKKSAKDARKQLSSVRQNATLDNAGVVTRSKRTRGITAKVGEHSNCSLALRPRAQFLGEKPMGDLVKPKAKRNRLGVNVSSGEHKESSDREPGNVNGKGIECIPKGTSHMNQSVPVTRRSSRNKLSTSLEVQKHCQHMAPDFRGSGDALDNCVAQIHCADGVQTRKRRNRSVMASENHDAEVETDMSTTPADSVTVDRLSNEVGYLQYTSKQDNTIERKCRSRTVSQRLDAPFGSIARQTRSKRGTHSALFVGEVNGQLSSAMLSSEKALQLCSDREDISSPPTKGTVSTVADTGLSGKLQKCAADVTPCNPKTPENAVSPICMGEDYLTPSCRKNLSLRKELYRLTDSEDICSSPFRVLRQRRDMNDVRVLFSQHLDEDIVRQQRKILLRLGVSEASSILEATHFVADMFVRTRNMLEAIANAKIVVTHLWLESCGQANCFIDEKNYVLRDSKKEKELCFSLPMSLARASSHPLLKGRRVFITPSIKPSKDVILNLVKAVHGQAIGRLCRSISNNEKLLDDLLVLSCEEDFEVCKPLLERGIAVYSSELLLNGIITQRLEFERHRLFVGYLKQTRATVWLREGDHFRRVAKAKQAACAHN